MSQKRFFIGGVEVGENGRRDYVLHLIDLVKGRFYRFRSREEVGEVVACLCSPGYADTVREECRMERVEGEAYELPVEALSQALHLDEESDLHLMLQELAPEALRASNQLERFIRRSVDERHAPEDRFDDVGAIGEGAGPVDLFEQEEVVEGDGNDTEIIFDEAVERRAVMPHDFEGQDFGEGSGAFFVFERDFTFDLGDVPEWIKTSYRILSFETAKVAAMQFDQVRHLIDHALESIGVKNPTPKEVVPTGPVDCGCQDDALLYENLPTERR